MITPKRFLFLVFLFLRLNRQQHAFRRRRRRRLRLASTHAQVHTPRFFFCCIPPLIVALARLSLPSLPQRISVAKRTRLPSLVQPSETKRSHKQAKQSQKLFLLSPGASLYLSTHPFVHTFTSPFSHYHYHYHHHQPPPPLAYVTLYTLFRTKPTHSSPPHSISHLVSGLASSPPHTTPIIMYQFDI